LKIIFVDDNPDLCASMQVLFTLHGHELRYFLRSNDVLGDAMLADWADVLISDYYLPDRNGTELIERLRARRPGMPAILLTGSREQSVSTAASRLGDCPVLYKPLDFEEIQDLMRKLVGPDPALAAHASAGSAAAA
jgi:DNA-binding NtrC family response regulator